MAGSDLRDLEDLGLLPREALDDAENDREKIKTATKPRCADGEEALPWFETMVEGSRLGKMRRSKGHGASGNGRYQVEWEIVEWTEDDQKLPLGGGKRKLGEVDEDSVGGVQ